MDYKITSYTYKKLDELNKNIRENITIKPSRKGYYKIDVFNGESYLFSIGDKRYLDFPSYLKVAGKEHANRRRELYYKRFGIAPKYSRKWFSSHLLW